MPSGVLEREKDALQIDVDQDVGLPYEEESVVRFVFNQDGKVTEVWGLSEDRYVLEQTGYTISR